MSVSLCSVHKGFFHKTTFFYLLANFSMKYILNCSFCFQSFYTERFYYHQPENKFDFFLSRHHCVKDTDMRKSPDRFLSVSPLLGYRGKTIESHCLDDDSALKKKGNLFSRSIHCQVRMILEMQAAVLETRFFLLLELHVLKTLLSISM